MCAKIGFYISVFNFSSSFAFAFCAEFYDHLLAVDAVVALQPLVMPPPLLASGLVVGAHVYVVLGGRGIHNDAAVRAVVRVAVLPLLFQGID